MAGIGRPGGWRCCSIPSRRPRRRSTSSCWPLWGGRSGWRGRPASGRLPRIVGWRRFLLLLTAVCAIWNSYGTRMELIWLSKTVGFEKLMLKKKTPGGPNHSPETASYHILYLMTCRGLALDRRPAARPFPVPDDVPWFSTDLVSGGSTVSCNCDVPGLARTLRPAARPFPGSAAVRGHAPHGGAVVTRPGPGRREVDPNSRSGLAAASVRVQDRKPCSHPPSSPASMSARAFISVSIRPRSPCAFATTAPASRR